MAHTENGEEREKNTTPIFIFIFKLLNVADDDGRKQN